MAEEIKKLIDIAGLTKYHENLKGVLVNEAATAKAYADSLAGNYDTAGAAAQALTDAKAYADGLVMVDGVAKFDAAGSAAAAKDAAIADAAEKYQVKGDYEAAGAAAQALADAKTYVDGKVDGKFDAAGAAATAEQNAKDYADGKFQVAGNYETAGAAAQALADAKTYVDGKVDGKFDAAGTAAGLNTEMDARVKVLEEIDHEQLAADASAAAVATILDGAPEKFDTLKEVAEWISATDSAASAADLVTRVSALEAIDHEAYKAADETVLESANSYADGLASNYDESGAAAKALADAKADAASLYQVKGDYATVGQVNEKQDIISDLQTIRDGAAAGATALQEVPAEYVTETELTGKGYLTANDFGFATDEDIDGLFS